MGPKSFRGFRKMGPSWLLHVSLTWARDANKTYTWSPVNFKKHVTSISSKLEPAIWSRDTGQRIPCFDRCGVTITWMSKIKEIRYKPRVCVSLKPICWSMVAILRDSVAVVCTHPGAIPLAMITMRKSIHGFSLLRLAGEGPLSDGRWL